MAEGKKSFVLYSDLIHSMKHLTLEQRGEVFTWILEYVNDENPKDKEGLMQGFIETIKQQLKRDLKKYEERAQRSRENGAKGGRPKNPKKPSGLNKNPDEPKKPDSDTVNDNDTVNDSVIKKKTPPDLIEFLNYAKDKSVELEIDLDESKVKAKYQAWIENGWRTGKNKRINNWKSTLLNTINYLKKEKSSDKKEKKPLVPNFVNPNDYE